MPVWDELRVVLQELQRANPCPLQGYPDPRVDRDRNPPFDIQLQPWATAVAERLHRRFGGEVRLVVGVLGYPEGEPPPGDWRQTLAAPDIAVSLSEPLVVASGGNARATITVTNNEAWVIVVNTSGQLLGRVLDPGTMDVVGTYSGTVRLPLVTFQIVPGGHAEIPMLVGTASVVRELGYSVPPGEWLMDTILTLADGRRVRTNVLPLTVTS